MNFTHLANLAADRFPANPSRIELELWLRDELQRVANEAVASMKFKCPLRAPGLCEGHFDEKAVKP